MSGKRFLLERPLDHIIASFDNEDYYYDSLSYGIMKKEGNSFSIYFILGLLNSKLLNSLHENLSDNKEKVFAKVLATNLSKLPIPKIDFSNNTQKQLHDQLVTLVTQMLESKKQLAAAVTDGDKNFLQNKCSSIDRQIDKLVYELYGLTEEEIKIVEGK